MSDEGNRKFFDAIGMLAAVITIITYLLLVINAQWEFIHNDTIMNILKVIRVYAPLVVVAITGLEWVSNKSFIVKLVFYAAMALIVISMFFPATWNQFVGLIN